MVRMQHSSWFYEQIDTGLKIQELPEQIHILDECRDLVQPYWRNEAITSDK